MNISNHRQTRAPQRHCPNHQTTLSQGDNQKGDSFSLTPLVGVSATAVGGMAGAAYGSVHHGGLVPGAVGAGVGALSGFLLGAGIATIAGDSASPEQRQAIRGTSAVLGGLIGGFSAYAGFNPVSTVAGALVAGAIGTVISSKLDDLANL